VRFLADLVFVSMLAVVTVTDLRERRIPNRVLIATVALGLPLLAVAALTAGAALLLAVVVRPGGFGMGDVKLIGVMGLFLGGAVLGAVLVALLVGSLAGAALFARHGTAAAKMTIPFGPFLALGALVALSGWIGSGSV
jgi:prepilin signal peptidase PulO-like enzyme (type II secretory pathway)